MNTLLILFGKLFSMISRFLNLGNGSTWPGHTALSVNKNFIKDIIKKNSHLKIILIAGTNGKTTTGKLIQTILEKNGKKVFQNQAGANLLNGVASSLLLHSDILLCVQYDYAIFEIDENTLPLILKEINNPAFIIILNLFRDQLDRYGEVNTIAAKWKMALNKLSSKTKLIMNADDPQIASLNLHPKGVDIRFFGLSDKKITTTRNQHAVDSTYCPSCASKLIYSEINYSHLGAWTCPKCNNTRPKLNISTSPIYPLLGIYNRYNTIAAVLVAKEIGIRGDKIHSSLVNFKPAFGRQEVLNVNGKKAHLFLTKNPTSFNESLVTIVELRAKNLLIVLNDRIPDGRDVSWIWDVDTEEYIKNFNYMIVSGDRAFDMGLRIKYSSEFTISNFQFSMKNSNFKFQIEEDLEKAIALSLEKTSKSETLYILPTYSAMLEVRKILTGKKIS